jgi:hypothetical protein
VGGGRKGYKRVNMVELLCSQVWNWKMRPVKTILVMVGGGDKAK